MLFRISTYTDAEINGVRIGDVRMKVTVKAGDVVRVGKRRFARIIIAD